MDEVVHILIKQDVINAFSSPGPDPEATGDSEEANGYGWLSQDKDALPDQITSAAVLVPLVDRDGGMTILLTKRTKNLKSHAGQISFPGGKSEPEDTSPEETALREAEEEIGLLSEKVEVVGRLGRRVTGSGFEVMPVVGIIDPNSRLTPNPREVAEIFEVPLSFVLNTNNHKRETRVIEGLEREFYVIPYKRYYIWGLTARLLVALSTILVKK